MMPYLFVFLLLLAGCTAAPPETDDKTPLVLQEADFSDLQGWVSDDHAAALRAFKTSCPRILKKSASVGFGPKGDNDKALGGTFGDWQAPCRALENVAAGEERAFFEYWFRPWQATAAGEEEGLFTGYYEASLKGARRRGGAYQYPLRLRPDDLVMVDLGAFRDDLKGRRIAGRVIGGRLKPFEERAEIIAGDLPRDEALSFVWVDDPVDAFFLHIQGSGVIEMDDGSVMRVGYAGQNGHPYYAIGRELIHRGHLTKETVSMQSIRAWLEANPAQAAEIMNTNKSYVFFRKMDKQGAVGGEGVVLTAGRSLAVDRTKVGYGIPVWLETKTTEGAHEGLNRLLVAQDTGGAIRGAVRGDVYWGFGDIAEQKAGTMKAKGQYWLLLPRSVLIN